VNSGWKAQSLQLQQNPVLEVDQAERRGLKRIQIGFRCAIAAFALIECWIARFSMNPDGVSYLDMGDMYWRGHWGAALNSYWSPFYSWMTGLVLCLSKPSMRWEYPIIHLLNLAVFLAMLGSFEFFWRQLLMARGDGTWSGKSLQAAWAMGYLLFASMHLGIGELCSVTPDQVVAALVYLVFGLLLRFSARRMALSSAAVLGIVLGIGYLTKAAMLSFGVVVCAVVLAICWKQRAGLRLAAVTIACFLAVCLPLIAALSWKTHRLNYGDAGKLNIAWFVNDIKPIFRHWQSDGGSSGQPTHSTRKIMNFPAVYEFGEPMDGTYPVWYAPAYWWEGVDSRMNSGRELTALLVNLKDISSYLLRRLGILTASILTIFLLGKPRLEAWRQLGRYWPILLPSAAVFLMYAMVTWEIRYTAAFMLTVYGALFVSSSCVQEDRRVIVVQVACLFVGLMVGALVLGGLIHTEKKAATWQRQIDFAEQLRLLGIKPGTKIALLGDGFEESLWARLDRVNIVAEVPRDFEWGDSTAAFWNASAFTENSVLDCLKNTGARAVIADIPQRELPPGWLRISDTGKAVYLFQ
jgi:hypothetical protein